MGKPMRPGGREPAGKRHPHQQGAQGEVIAPTPKGWKPSLGLSASVSLPEGGSLLPCGMGPRCIYSSHMAPSLPPRLFVSVPVLLRSDSCSPPDSTCVPAGPPSRHQLCMAALAGRRLLKGPQWQEQELSVHS